MDEKQAAAILTAIDNKTLQTHWNKLDTQQKECLSKQLKDIDLSVLQLQQNLICEPQSKSRLISPFASFAKAGHLSNRKLGLKAISEGLFGCLVIAGGQGSRLRIEGPKGVCAVTKIRKKSLFQLFAEKTIAAGKQAKRLLPLAIMTSPLNHEDTVAFFQKHDFFGLNHKQVTFFPQETLPILDPNGHIFLEALDSLAVGPDGNGGALHQFFKSGLWDKWHSDGVRYLNFVLIDNPLADPFDAELIGYQQRQKSDVVVKCTNRKKPEENVGLLVQENGKAAVVEYSELSQEERYACNLDGSLQYLLANISLFSFDMAFIRQIITTQLPLHKSFKAVKYWDSQGLTIQAEKPMAWKFETFIFDVLPLAKKVDVLLYPRETCFAPLKNFSGSDSLETVSHALEKRDQKIIEAITGHECQIIPLEIAQDFYYPTEELIAKWKGKTINQSGYLES